MQSIIDNNNRLVVIFLFLCSNLLLFGLLKLGKFLFAKLSGNAVISKKILEFYPSIELFVWFSYLFISLPYFYQYNFFFAIFLTFFLVVMAVWLAWYSMSDIVAGFVVRSNPAISKNKKVIIDNQPVTISRLMPGYMQGTLENGTIIFVRYRKLLSKEILHIDDNHKSTSKTLQLKVPRSIYSNQINQSIRSFLLAQPYYAVKYPPAIKTAAEDAQYVTLSVTFYVLNAEKIHEVENAVRTEFEKQTTDNKQNNPHN